MSLPITAYFYVIIKLRKIRSSSKHLLKISDFYYSVANALGGLLRGLTESLTNNCVTNYQSIKIFGFFKLSRISFSKFVLFFRQKPL